MSKNILRFIREALQEDGAFQDITTSCLIAKNQVSVAQIIVNEKAVVCGLNVVQQVFKAIDPRIQVHPAYKDGDTVLKGRIVARLRGPTAPLLRGERVALNFLAHLSGIATLTDQFVQKVKGFGVNIMDTRKTLPGLRALEKYAVRCGGGVNHRDSLNEMVFIKDNHLSALKASRSISKIIAQVRRRIKKILAIEVEDLSQFKKVLKNFPDIILLDNMSPALLGQAVRLRHQNKNYQRIQLEASGGVTLKNVRKIARTGVDRISIGALTHSARAIDFSMKIF